jgi:hypothetical protein
MRDLFNFDDFIDAVEFKQLVLDKNLDEENKQRLNNLMKKIYNFSDEEIQFKIKGLSKIKKELSEKTKQLDNTESQLKPLDEILKEDAFYKHQVATYHIQEFNPTKLNIENVTSYFKNYIEQNLSQ